MQIHPLGEERSTTAALETILRLEWTPIKAPLTSLDGLVQEAPPTLVHHVHVRLAVNQSGSNALQLA